MPDVPTAAPIALTPPIDLAIDDAIPDGPAADRPGTRVYSVNPA